MLNDCVRTSWSIFTSLRSVGSSNSPPVFPSSSLFSVLGEVPSLVGGFDPLVCWFCMEPTGFTRRDETRRRWRRKCLSSYCDGRCSTVRLRVFLVSVRIAGSAKISQNRWTREPWLTIVQVRAWCQVSAPWLGNRPRSRSLVFNNLVSLSLGVNGGIIVG